RATVVGVFDMPKDDSGDAPKLCLVPFRVALERLGAPPEDVRLLLRVGSTKKLLEVEKSLEALTPHLREGIGAASYRVESQREELEGIEGQTRMEATLLGGVAALSMIVAAGGILNTLLVGVRERTREIGTRRALGARRSAIRSQFLLEAVALSLPGAVLGLGAGVLLARGLGALFAAGLKNPSLLEVRVESADLLSAGLVALAVAVVAGVGPAWIAAKVAPAEALRYE
ncbi:MAG TPA: ABC transporter permease, partial [Thermoanaerobaculia bacterium]|nr:ABC transporter permease [Thermoanaerobaculia bacterium]